MLVFIDFEASSLAKKSYPIEVAWVFEDGRAEAHLIRPAPSWTDWGEEAEGLHKITLATLLRDGTAHDVVAGRMVSELDGHELLASSVPWDGKWLSVLLRGAGLHRRSLRARPGPIRSSPAIAHKGSDGRSEYQTAPADLTRFQAAFSQ